MLKIEINSTQIHLSENPLITVVSLSMLQVILADVTSPLVVKVLIIINKRVRIRTHRRLEQRLVAMMVVSIVVQNQRAGLRGGIEVARTAVRHDVALELTRRHRWRVHGGLRIGTRWEAGSWCHRLTAIDLVEARTVTTDVERARRAGWRWRRGWRRGGCGGGCGILPHPNESVGGGGSFDFVHCQRWTVAAGRNQVHTGAVGVEEVSSTASLGAIVVAGEHAGVVGGCGRDGPPGEGVAIVSADDFLRTKNLVVVAVAARLWFPGWSAAGACCGCVRVLLICVVVDPDEGVDFEVHLRSVCVYVGTPIASRSG